MRGESGRSESATDGAAGYVRAGAMLALILLLCGCGKEPSVPMERVQRTFLVSYSDGTSDTIRADAFYHRGWNNEAIEFISGWSSVGYITRPATVRELP